MAKLDRPLFGTWASGTAFRVLAFRHTANPAEPPGDPVISLGTVAKIPVMSCPPSASQTARRLQYAAAVAAWHALSTGDRILFALVKPANLSGYNFFIRLFLLPWLSYLGYCVFGSTFFQLVPSPDQPAALEYAPPFPAGLDEFPAMVDGAHGPQAWLYNRACLAAATIETYLIDHRSSLER